MIEPMMLDRDGKLARRVCGLSAKTKALGRRRSRAAMKRWVRRADFDGFAPIRVFSGWDVA